MSGKPIEIHALTGEWRKIVTDGLIPIAITPPSKKTFVGGVAFEVGKLVYSKCADELTASLDDKVRQVEALPRRRRYESDGTRADEYVNLIDVLTLLRGPR